MKQFFLAFTTLLAAQMFWLPLTHGATQNRDYDQACKSVANKVLNEYIKCDYNMSLYNKAYDEWLKYAKSYTIESASKLYTSLECSMEELRKSLKAPSTISFTEDEINILRTNGLQISVLLCHNDEYKHFYEEMNQNIGAFLLSGQSNPTMLQENFQLSHHISMLSFETLYYNMLHSFSALSSNIFDQSMKAKLADLNYKYSIDINLPAEEYERMYNAAINKIERAVTKMHTLHNTHYKQSVMAEDYEDRYNRACEVLDKAIIELEELFNITLDSNDTKGTALEKINRSTDIIDRFEACAEEYINSLTAVVQHMNMDMNAVNQERETLTDIINKCKSNIKNMKIIYENM